MIILPYRPEELAMFVALRVFFGTAQEEGVPIVVPNALANAALARKITKLEPATTPGSKGTLVLTRLGERELERFIRWMDHEWKPFGHEPEAPLATPDMQLPP